MVAEPLVPYLVAFALSALASGAVAVWLRTATEGPGARELAAMFAAISLWACNSALRVVATDRAATQVLLATETTLIAATAVLWFVFAARYANRAALDGPLVREALAAYVAGGLLVPLTNPIHGLMWTSIRPERSAGVVTYAVTKGPAHYVLTVGAYVLVFLGLYYLVSLLWSSARSRPAVASLVVGLLSLVGANLAPYLDAGLPVDHSGTVAPLGAVFSALAVVVAVRFDLFRLVPVGRDVVVRELRDPVVVLDARRRVADANRAFRETFGAASRAVEFAEGYPELAAAVPVDAEEARTLTVETDEGTRHFSVTVSAIGGRPDPHGHALLFRDVTRLTELNRELERRNEQLDEFVYSAAHNLRNPLGVVSGYAELLGARLDEDTYDRTFVRRSLEKIGANADRMDEIVTDFLRVTRASKGLATPEPVAFGATARAAFAALSDADDLSLTVEDDGELSADPGRLEMLLHAVFRSARDRADGTATVTARLTADGFVVADTARPVDPEDAEVFLSYGYTTKYPGTGLGLAVVETLADAHGWSVRLDTDYDAGVKVIVTGARTTLDAATDAAAAEDPGT